MEQKMILPIVIVVLVAGFLIGFYAATSSSTGKQSVTNAAAQNSATLLGTEYEDTMVTSAVYMESIVGYLQAMDKSSITINRDGKTAVIPLASNTVVMVYSKGSRVVVPFGYPKQNDLVNIQTVTNADTNTLVKTSVTVLKRAQ